MVTDLEGRLLSRGRNRIFEDEGPPGSLYGHRLAHAEMNALVALERRRADRVECVLYTTTEPCPLCTGDLRQYGVREVFYASRDPAGGSIELLRASPFMRRRLIWVVGPQERELEVVIMALHTEFFLRVRPMSPEWWLFQAWESVVPEGIRLGETLAESGELGRMAAEGASVSEVVERLVASS